MNIFNDDVFLLEGEKPYPPARNVLIRVCVFLVPCGVGLLLDVSGIALVKNAELFIVLDKAQWW